MNTYVAVLRGINVSGQKTIIMKDLKALFAKEGFENPMTYIQSGNIVFGSNEKNTKKLEKIIGDMIEKEYRFEVPVMVILDTKISKIMDENPFSGKDTSKLHVTFLSQSPDSKLLETTRDEKFQSDEFQINDDVVYLYCPDGYGMTKYSTTFFEKKLNVTATTRTWKTLEALKNLIELVQK